jgi:hypothetical protein
MTQNATNKKLTLRQAKALEAIMSERSIQAAAQKAGVERKTLYRWMAEESFASALREMRNQTFDRTMNSLADAAELAVEVLREILADKEAARKDGASIQIRAASKALDSMLRSRDLIEIEQRLKKLEDLLLHQGRL